MDKTNSNILTETLKKLLDRIAILKGSLFHIERIIINYSKEYQESWEQSNHRKPKKVLFSKLIISDITSPTDRGADINHPTKSDYSVSLEKYQEKGQDLICHFSHFTISQSYDAFETFIKDILGDYFSIRPKEGDILLKKERRKENDWRLTIRNMRPGENNHNYFNLLRKISPELKKGELINNKKINLSQWYCFFSEARHSIVHSKGIIDNKWFSKLSGKNRLIFDEYFHTKQFNDLRIVHLSKNQADEVCKLISEYAFLIFKSLSIKLSSDWRIFKTMQ